MTTITNVSVLNASEERFHNTPTANRDSSSEVIKYFIILCFMLYSIFGLIVARAIKKTKLIPSMAKYLAISLIHCYTLVAVTSTFRRLIGMNNNEIVFVLTVLCSAFGWVRFIIVAMLAIDRIIVLLCPFIYCRFIPRYNMKVKCATVILWFVIFVTNVISIIVQCDFFTLASESDNLSCFKNSSRPYVIAIFGPTFVIVGSCSIIMVKTLHVQTQDKSVKILSQKYKTTLATLANIINYLVVVAVIFTSTLFLDSTYTEIIVFEALGWCNAVVDVFIYAIWFRECRLELLKMAAVLLPKLDKHAEKLRYQIFDIQMASTIDKDLTAK